ncbi:MAG: hypothetical protein HRU71_00535 [Planctomycetia bacterium]|nr:MAG: hypothetical protein HRU71_00535 [Planctomycetia bacterium]
MQQQGTTYTRLDLGCNATVGECKWRITTQAFIANGTFTNYSLWIRDPAGAATQLSLSETSVAGAPFTNHLLPPVENRPDGVLSSLIVGLPQGGSPIPAGPTIYNLHSYVLTSQAGIAPGTLMQLRAGSEGFGGFEPAVQPPFNTRRVVAFGANPGFQIAGGEWPNPVIHINYVPEPTTAAMLLAPAVLLMPRRARRGRGTCDRTLQQ